MEFLKGLRTIHKCQISCLFVRSYSTHQQDLILCYTTRKTNNNFYSEIDSNGSNTQIICTPYEKSVHNKFVCFKRNGFPSNHEGKSSRNYTKRICTYCGGKHVVDVSYKKHGFSSGHKFFNSKTNYVKKLERAGGEQDMHLTQQQYQTLFSLLVII